MDIYMYVLCVTVIVTYTTTIVIKKDDWLQLENL